MPYLNNDFSRAQRRIKGKKLMKLKVFIVHLAKSQFQTWNRFTCANGCKSVCLAASVAYPSQVLSIISNYTAQYIQVELPKTKHSRLHNEVNMQLDDCPLVDVVLSFNIRAETSPGLLFWSSIGSSLVLPPPGIAGPVIVSRPIWCSLWHWFYPPLPLWGPLNNLPVNKELSCDTRKIRGH